MSVVAFHAEWFDSVASIVKTFRVNHFVDGTIEVIYLKNRQTFLKRTFFPDIQRSDFSIGATITLNARQMKIIDYADEGTKAYYNASTQLVFGLIKPGALFGPLLSGIEKIISFTRLKMVYIDQTLSARFKCAKGLGVCFEATIFSKESGLTIFALFQLLFVNFVLNFPICCTVQMWAEYSSSKISVLYSSISSASRADIDICFSRLTVVSGALSTTACVLKPHLFKDSNFGNIIDAIEEAGYKIVHLEMTQLDYTTASSFFDVYKFLPYYGALVEHAIDGKCVFVMLEGSNIVEDFREFCGPNDPEVARALRPASLRARYGLSKVRNALHCTDLPEDGHLECQFFLGALESN